MEGGRSQNYWPGFVDALSNVVLTLVFVLVIFVFALAMASNKVEQKRKEIVQSEKTQASQVQETTQLKEQLATLTKELQQFKGQASASNQNEHGSVEVQAVTTQNEEKQIVIDSKEQKQVENQGPVTVKNATNTVILSYPLTVTEMDKESQDKLGHILDAIQKTNGARKALIRSIVGKETYSVAKRAAYYRAINARNTLIMNMGFTPSNITLTIVTPPQPENGHVEIIFQDK